MSASLIVIWFFCGMAGLHLSIAMEKDVAVRANEGGVVWAVLLGPVLLMGAVYIAIAKATEKKS